MLYRFAWTYVFSCWLLSRFESVLLSYICFSLLVCACRAQPLIGTNALQIKTRANKISLQAADVDSVRRAVACRRHCVIGTA